MLNRENLRLHIPLNKQRTETETEKTEKNVFSLILYFSKQKQKKKTEKLSIFPVPVSSADVEFNQSDSKKRTTEQISAHYLLEKISRVLYFCYIL